jgi:nickel/cobalt transporter (NiCoT) family protein
MQSRILQLFDDGNDGRLRGLIGIYAVLIGANLLAWTWAFAEFGGRPTLLGTALLAYIFGLRHAVDADHIAAIDNVVRKLMQDGQRPLHVGFYFSLGHSTVVVLATAAIALSAATLRNQLDTIKDLGGMIGTTVSALFLLAIALVNLVTLQSVWSHFKDVRRGERVGVEGLDALLAGHGFLTRLLRPLFRVVSKSWHMYPLGFLFGLGFDTATEIGLLGISAAQASQGMSAFSIMVFPALFTAGMALVDTTDGILMVGAYGWAFINPKRKLWYNLTITAASVVVALLIGSIEALGLLAAHFNLSGAFWIAISKLNGDLASFGVVVVGLLLVSWIVSAMIYRWRSGDLIPD